MNDKDKIGFACVKRACMVCGKLYDAEIVINKLLSEYQAKKVEAMHGQTVGFLDKPCEECQELMKQGIVFVMFDREKTGADINPETVWRTGNIVVLREEAATRILGDLESYAAIMKHRWIYMPQDIATEIGIIQPQPKTNE